MVERLGRQHSNRTVYDKGNTMVPASCSACPELKLAFAAIDGLREELKDQHLTERDITFVALRTCSRINDSLPVAQHVCRLFLGEPPKTVADNLPNSVS